MQIELGMRFQIILLPMVVTCYSLLLPTASLAQETDKANAALIECLNKPYPQNLNCGHVEFPRTSSGTIVIPTPPDGGGIIAKRPEEIFALEKIDKSLLDLNFQLPTMNY